MSVSIHAFRGEGDQSVAYFQNCFRVSIHAFRGEGDLRATGSSLLTGVSIHAFRGEGDAIIVFLDDYLLCFNPRLPGGRRLVAWIRIDRLKRGFNPRLPGGRRLMDVYFIVVAYTFQSTPSGGKATEGC